MTLGLALSAFLAARSTSQTPCLGPQSRPWPQWKYGSLDEGSLLLHGLAVAVWIAEREGILQIRGGILRVRCQRELRPLTICGHLEVHSIPWQDPLGQSELSISRLDNRSCLGQLGPLAKEAHIAHPSRHEPPLRSVPMAAFDRLRGFQ